MCENLRKIAWCVFIFKIYHSTPILWCTTGVGGGGAKDFCPNFPKLARKKLQTKRLHFISFWAHFLQIKAHQAPFLPKFTLTCPKKAKKLPPKKRMHFDFGRHFLKINTHQAILRRFSHILRKFP